MLFKILTKYTKKGKKIILSQNFKIIVCNFFITGKHHFISAKQGTVTANTWFLTLEPLVWSKSEASAAQMSLHPGNSLTSSSFKALLLHLKTEHVLEMGICKEANSGFVSRLTKGLSNFQVKALFVPVALCSVANWSQGKKNILEWKPELFRVTEH